MMGVYIYMKIDWLCTNFGGSFVVLKCGCNSFKDMQSWTRIIHSNLGMHETRRLSLLKRRIYENIILFYEKEGMREPLLF